MKKIFYLLIFIVASICFEVEAKQIHRECEYESDDLIVTVYIYDDYSVKGFIKKYGDKDEGTGNAEDVQNWGLVNEAWSGVPNLSLLQWAKNSDECAKKAYAYDNFFGYKLYLSNKDFTEQTKLKYEYEAPLTNSILESEAGYEGICYCHTDYPANGDKQLNVKVTNCSTNARTCSYACGYLQGGGASGYIWFGDFPDPNKMLQDTVFPNNILKPDTIKDCSITKNAKYACYSYIDPTGNERSRETYWGINPSSGWNLQPDIKTEAGCKELSDLVDDKIIKSTQEYHQVLEEAKKYEERYLAGEIIGSGDILSPGMIKILNEVYLAIRIITPILAGALSMFDFAKAMASEDKDALKKSFKHLSVRVVIVVLIFLLPTLINLIGSLTGLGTLPSGLF